MGQYNDEILQFTSIRESERAMAGDGGRWRAMAGDGERSPAPPAPPADSRTVREIALHRISPIWVPGPDLLEDTISLIKNPEVVMFYHSLLYT